MRNYWLCAIRPKKILILQPLYWRREKAGGLPPIIWSIIVHVSIKCVSKMAQSAYSVLKLLYADWQFWTQIWWQHRMLDCSIKKIKCKQLGAQINLKGKMADSPIIWIALNSPESSDNLNTIRPKNLANNFLAESSHKFKAYGRKFFFKHNWPNHSIFQQAESFNFFNRPNRISLKDHSA